MAIKTDDASTLQEIDEALNYLVETLRTTPNPKSFMAIIDELLDARNEMNGNEAIS